MNQWINESGEDLMKRFLSLILFVLVTTFSISAQDQTPVVAKPTIKLAGITLLVRDYDKAAKVVLGKSRF
jgi:hypothetical protein